MAKLNWQDAIVKVLHEAGKPLPYAEIAQAIIDGGLRKSVGATPASTVAAVVSMSLKNEGDASPFFKPERGVYGLRAVNPEAPNVEEHNEAEEDSEQMGLINAFGLFWRRGEVDWTARPPSLKGSQQPGSEEVDFGPQVGVYFLHDRDRVIYVGRVTEPRLGARLGEHTRDRLGGRWDRFSWFGVRKVTQEGRLSNSPEDFTLENLISTMESLLIEALEPPQNRRQGDSFNTIEFLQGTDPKLARQRNKQLLDELAANIN